MLQQTLGALAAFAVLGLLLVGPMVLAVSAGDTFAVADRCASVLDC